MRFGMLGTGFWAREVHAASIAGHPDHELVGVWGRDQAKAEAAGAPFEAPGYTDLDELLAQVDAVAIALPPDVQAPLALRAAEAGKHLLLEKPIALDVPSADRMVEAVRAAGVASVVFFTLRFRESSAAWLAQAQRMRLVGGAGTWIGSRAGTPFGPSPWRDQQGALWDLGPHALSLFLPTLGPVREVQAGGGMGDTVHLVLHHDGGASTALTLSHTVPAMAEGTEFYVYGDAGRAVLLPEAGPPLDAYRLAIDELVAAAVTGGTHPCDVGFGRDVVVVLAAAQRALASGCREPVET